MRTTKREKTLIDGLIGRRATDRRTLLNDRDDLLGYEGAS